MGEQGGRMKFVTIYDEETNDVVVQLVELEDGSIDGVVLDGMKIIVDGNFVSYGQELHTTSAMPCSCGAFPDELEFVKTVVHYTGDNDIDIEYKVVCPKCGKESELAPNRDGAVIAWNEGLIKEKLL